MPISLLMERRLAQSPKYRQHDEQNPPNFTIYRCEMEPFKRLIYYSKITTQTLAPFKRF